MTSSWTVMTLAFAGMLYFLFQILSLAEPTPFQWFITVGCIGVCLLMIFQSVKSLMAEEMQ